MENCRICDAPLKKLNTPMQGDQTICVKCTAIEQKKKPEQKTAEKSEEKRCRICDAPLKKFDIPLLFGNKTICTKCIETEKGVKDLKEDLDTGLQSLAELKAQAIRSKGELKSEQETASSYEKKAMLLLQKVQKSELDSAEADRLAAQALQQRDASMKRVNQLNEEQQKHDSMVQKLEDKIKHLKAQIGAWENKRTFDSARSVNKQLSRSDASGALGVLEKDDKTGSSNSLAELKAKMGIQ